MKRFVLSKWAKTQALISQPHIKKYIPKTMKCSFENLRQMLHQYGMIYLKPDIGTYGKGVIRVEHKAMNRSNIYRYQIGENKKVFEHFSNMYSSLLSTIRHCNYIIQKGIDLCKFEGLPYDLRVMVQKTLNHRWETTGMIGRVAHPKKIVTNVHNGGSLMRVEKLIANYLPPEKWNAYLNKLKKMGRLTAVSLHRKYRGIREIGIDVGLDQKLKPWILEINTFPDPYIFKKLKNKKAYARIIRFYKHNLK